MGTLPDGIDFVYLDILAGNIFIFIIYNVKTKKRRVSRVENVITSTIEFLSESATPYLFFTHKTSFS